MQYLLQPHSKAERLVLSFPATAANYSKAIEQLKERFGRDDLLVQIYVRDLLGLVMKNAVKERSKTDLTYMYEELEGKLRALESLGRTQEKYGDFLIPLVESCLPEETLLAWERSRNHESTQNTRSLEHLMNFLRKEVQGEEMVQLARTGFGPQHNFRKNNAPVECVRQSDLATTSALVSLDAEPLTCEVRITKRLILSVVQKIFDPIGLLTPTTLLPKLLLQNLWKLKICWDHELPPNCKKEFLAWFKDTSVLKNVNIPRHLKVNISSELHVFVDVSWGAYAACVIVRSIIDSKVNIVLVRAKSRVAPLKPFSIPRLELMACNVGVRLVNSLMKALNFPNLKITFWSDSTTALWWIKEQGNWSVFVSNRVKEIRLLTKTHSWKHVPANMNPADLLSRGSSPYKFLKSKWWEGPAWLKENSEKQVKLLINLVK
ncbi:integrase catalytic domain-containing protein [Trichonephila clavipes]|nr:integrase catalytic domain-containing protein [Trichonephila clavipes]